MVCGEKPWWLCEPSATSAFELQSLETAASLQVSIPDFAVRDSLLPRRQPGLLYFLNGVLEASFDGTPQEHVHTRKGGQGDGKYPLSRFEARRT